MELADLETNGDEIPQKDQTNKFRVANKHDPYSIEIEDL